MKSLRQSARASLATFALLVATTGPSQADDIRDDPSLAPATLRLTDVPEGWAITDATGRSENGGRLPPLCGLTAPIPSARSARGFAGEVGSSVTSIVMRFKAGQAKRFLDALAGALRTGCQQIIETGLEGSDPINARYERFTVAKLGDQALGLRLTNAPFASEVVLIRRGNLLSIVATGAISGPALSATPLANAAATRLSRIR